MEEEKIPKQKLIHPSIDDYLLLKNQRGTWQRPRKILTILFYRGNMTRGGNMAKGITVIVIYFTEYKHTHYQN